MMGPLSSRSLLLLAVMLAAPFAGGCTEVLGEQEADANFPVDPRSDYTFAAWNEITIDTGGVDVDTAYLLAVTLDTDDPPGSPDMSFLTSIIGEGVNGPRRQEFCVGSNFPPGEQAVSVDVTFHDNIIPFFSGTDTIRVEWSGTVNPAFSFPADGFEIRARFKIEPE